MNLKCNAYILADQLRRRGYQVSTIIHNPDIEYVIYDMFMRPMFLDWARMDWDGQTATFPDADSWQGEVELKVADSYW